MLTCLFYEGDIIPCEATDCEYFSGFIEFAMELLRGKLMWKKRENGLQEVTVEEALAHKDLVMFYFGHSSCQLHIEFLSALKDIYQVIVTHNIPMEVIYVSSENDLNEFKNHFLTEHGDWLAVPCGDEVHLLLEYKFEITSIPRVVVIRKSGKVLTLDGYREILSKGKYALTLWISPFL